MSDADALIGHQVGRYVINEYLREDRLGKVYVAVELPSRRRVDVKVLDPSFATNDELFARFGREMLATATINHPNTVAMLDFGDHRKLFHYIVLEHVDATTLEDELASHGKLEPDRVARIAWQVTGALTAAHAEKIIHRGLCPANLLLLRNAEGDFVKVRDFGLSRLADTEDPNGPMLTAAGARVGHTEYMAPEYISAAVVDQRGDLYALGIVMYEMLVGQPPYTGKTAEVIEKHMTAETPRVSATVRGTPRWLDELVYTLMARDPDRRPASAEDVRAILEAHLGDVDLPALTEAPIPKAKPANPAESVSKLAVYAGFALIALICVGLALAIGLTLFGP